MKHQIVQQLCQSHRHGKKWTLLFVLLNIKSSKNGSTTNHHHHHHHHIIIVSKKKLTIWHLYILQQYQWLVGVVMVWSLKVWLKLDWMISCALLVQTLSFPLRLGSRAPPHGERSRVSHVSNAWLYSIFSHYNFFAEFGNTEIQYFNYGCGI